MSKLTESVWAAHAAEEAGDRRVLKRAMICAAIVHVVILLVTVPASFTEPPPEDDEARPVFVVQTPRFKPPPPEPEPEPPRQQPTKSIPVPDMTPDDPEPVVLEPPPMLEPMIDIPISIPDAPPAPPPPEAPKMLRVGVDVTPPERLHYVAPQYTEAARRARVSGPVVLELTIDRQGEVTDVKVLKEQPLGLTDAAVRAAEQWRFEPSTADGEPVSVKYVLTVRYGLTS